MIYFIHPTTHTTRTCETEETARRAEREGYIRVGMAEWRTQRMINDLAEQARIRQEVACGQ